MTSRLTLLTKEIVEGDVRSYKSIVYEAINKMTGKRNLYSCPHAMEQTGVNCIGCSFTSVDKFQELMRLLDTYE